MSQRPHATQRSDSWAARYTMTLESAGHRAAGSPGGGGEAGSAEAAGLLAPGSVGNGAVMTAEIILEVALDLDV